VVWRGTTLQFEVRSVQALFSSHLEYHQISLQILEVLLVAHFVRVGSGEYKS
jgi:hypothetical protein